MAVEAASEGLAEHLARRISRALEHRTLAVAESCTAGEVASALATGGGAADWLRGGVVAYQTAVKRELLGVTARSVVTPAAAAQMADGVARLLGADAAVATTGVFGDEAVDGVEPTVVIVASLVDGKVRTAEHRLDDDPDRAGDEATLWALRLLADHLDDADDADGSDAAVRSAGLERGDAG